MAWLGVWLVVLAGLCYRLSYRPPPLPPLPRRPSLYPSLHSCLHALPTAFYPPAPLLSALGKFPKDAVAIMARTCMEAEATVVEKCAAIPSPLPPPRPSSKALLAFSPPPATPRTPSTPQTAFPRRLITLPSREPHPPPPQPFKSPGPLPIGTPLWHAIGTPLAPHWHPIGQRMSLEPPTIATPRSRSTSLPPRYQ